MRTQAFKISVQKKWCDAPSRNDCQLDTRTDRVAKYFVASSYVIFSTFSHSTGGMYLSPSENSIGAMMAITAETTTLTIAVFVQGPFIVNAI